MLIGDIVVLVLVLLSVGVVVVAAVRSRRGMSWGDRCCGLRGPWHSRSRVRKRRAPAIRRPNEPLKATTG